MRIGFLFPGQGSDRTDMASAWSGHPAASVFDEVGEVVGCDLVRAAADPATGATTAIAQPAIFAASLVSLQALRDAGIEPCVVAGHSLGEVTAAVAAGSLDLRAGAELVAERGRAMGRACRTSPGTMAAVLRLDDADLDEVLAVTPDVVVANVNAPGQTVISGPAAGIERAGRRVKERGGRLRTLDVEGPFHSPAMAPALVRVDAVLRRLEVRDPHTSLVTGTSGAVLRNGAAVTHALVDGVLSAVRWRAVQERLAAFDLDLLLEVGPGGVLAGLAKRTIPDLPCRPAATPDDVARLADELTAVNV